MAERAGEGASMEGSDVSTGSDSEMEGECSGRNTGMNEWSKIVNRKRKKTSINESGTDSEKERMIAKTSKEDYKVLMKFANSNGINPVKLTKALKKAVGDIESAKTLRNGNILIFCKNEKQQKALRSVKSMLGQTVSCIIYKRAWLKGVISGIPIEVSTDTLKSNISGAKVTEAKRLKCVRNKEKVDSLSVVLQFEEEKMPERVYIGYVSYLVRAYVPPPVRCFKCQKYGHVAAVCKGNQRCARCSGNHEYGKCGQGTKPRCCNCGGEHSAGFGGCMVHKNAVKIQNVRIHEGISYSEAVKKVKQTEEGQGNEVTIQMNEYNRSSQTQHKINEDELFKVGKVEFMTFLAEVINCAAQTVSRTERIKIIIKAAEKHLQFEGITLEQVNEKLKGQVVDSQSTSGGS